MTDINALGDRYVAYRKRTEHELALWSGDMLHLERWDDVTAGGLESRRRSLEEFEREALELLAEGASDWRERSLGETVAFGAWSARTQMAWREELRWVNHTMGVIPMTLTFLPRFPLATAEDGARYLEKLHGFGTFVDMWRARLDDGARAGIVPIRHHVASLIHQIEVLLRRQMSATRLARQAPPSRLSPAAAAAWREQLLLTLDTTVAPALHRLVETLRTATLPVARPDDRPGLCHLDGGEAVYADMLRASITTDHTPADVHEIGLEHISRLEDEYRQVGAAALDETDVPTLYRRLRDDPDLHYQSAEQLVDDARRALERAQAASEDWFRRLPVSPCSAEAIEQGPLAYYSRPLADGSKDGTFFFNTKDPAMWGTFQLESTTFHEGIPGHHLQLALAVEDDQLHDVHREFGVAAYAEGWGLYSERLADEMGLYSSELDRLGMLAADSMRACRLVVDTGLHAMGWSRDRAIRYMVDNSPVTAVQIEGEIDRYIGVPGQAASYLMGRREIEDIRATAEQRPDWDRTAFHDSVLSCGSVPLATLRSIVLDTD